MFFYQRRKYANVLFRLRYKNVKKLFYNETREHVALNLCIIQTKTWIRKLTGKKNMGAQTFALRIVMMGIYDKNGEYSIAKRRKDSSSVVGWIIKGSSSGKIEVHFASFPIQKPSGGTNFCTSLLMMGVHDEM